MAAPTFGRNLRLPVTRLVALTLPSLFAVVANAGWFAEHKYIGDVAFKRFVEHHQLRGFLAAELNLRAFGTDLPSPFQRNRVVHDIYDGLLAFQSTGRTFTYGDICGLAADHSVDHHQLERALLNPDPNFMAGANSSLFKSLDDDVFKALTSHHAGIEEFKKQGDYSALAYLLLASEDKSHFNRPPDDLLTMLGAVDSTLVKALERFRSATGNTIEARAAQRELDRCFLRLNNPAKYAVLHMMALDAARQAGTSFVNDDHERFQRDLLRAFVMNAFADHFLQDAFAGGHLPVQRSFLGLDDNGVHDFYCRVGVTVSNARMETWRTFGDNYYDDATFRHAIDANLRSLEELWEAFDDARGPDGISPLGELYMHLAFHDIPPAGWPALLNTSFTAFSHMPIPLSETNYNDSIRLKHGSTSGFFWEAGATRVNKDDFGLHGAIGIGRALIKPPPPGEFKDAAWRQRVEAILWFGFGAEYQRELPWSDGRDRVFGKLFFSWKDRIAFEVGARPECRNDISYFAGNLAIGYEQKYLTCRLAPSLKYVLDYGAGREPAHGIRLAFRLY